MDGLLEGDDMVRVLVRAPDQQIDDQIVNCQLDWTVARLKDHLAEVYPSKPKRGDQKVIFSGHILNDTMVLKDVLQQFYNETEKTFIIHLVCPMLSKSLNVNANKETTANESTRVPATTNIPQTSSSSQQPSPIQQYYGQLNNQQMAWMQQAYAHYLTQYMQHMAAHGIPLQSTIPYGQPQNPNPDTINTTNTSSNHINTEENGEQIRPGAQEGVDANAINNNNNNNNNNGEENEAGVNRDWLDVFDVLARLVVLSSIVYFYSSPSRFLIVTFLGFAIYLLQGGFFRGQQAYLADNNNARGENNQANEPAPAAAVGDRSNNVQESAETTTTTNQEARTTNANEVNERPGALAFTWTFFISFFASLIPEQPHVI